MPIRPLNLPQDFSIGLHIFGDIFHYPDHPEWEASPEQREMSIDQINTFKRWWFLVRLLGKFSPHIMDSLRGYVWEEDERPVGIVLCHRQNPIRWEIGILGVLPQYRRRGIAQQLLQSALDFVKRQDGKLATISVVNGNLPASELYQRMGFVPYALEIPYSHIYPSPLPIANIALPAGYRLERIRFLNRRPIYELERRIIPDSIARYRPVELETYQSSLPQELFFVLMERLSGIRSRNFLISYGKEAVAWGFYNARMRTGGINYIFTRSNQAHPEIAEYLMAYLLNSVQKEAPGKVAQFTLYDWQNSELKAASDLGCQVGEPKYLCLGKIL